MDVDVDVVVVVVVDATWTSDVVVVDRGRPTWDVLPVSLRAVRVHRCEESLERYGLA